MMKKSTQTIMNQTLHGRIFKCDQCDRFHIEFKNLNFNFTKEQLESFVDYLVQVDGEWCEQQNQRLAFRRKIVLPIGHDYFNVLLNADELQELKQLLNFNPVHHLWSVKAAGLQFVTGLS